MLTLAQRIVLFDAAAYDNFVLQLPDDETEHDHDERLKQAAQELGVDIALCECYACFSSRSSTSDPFVRTDSVSSSQTTSTAETSPTSSIISPKSKGPAVSPERKRLLRGSLPVAASSGAQLVREADQKKFSPALPPTRPTDQSEEFPEPSGPPPHSARRIHSMSSMSTLRQTDSASSRTLTLRRWTIDKFRLPRRKSSTPIVKSADPLSSAYDSRFKFCHKCDTQQKPATTSPGSFHKLSCGHVVCEFHLREIFAAALPSNHHGLAGESTTNFVQVASCCNEPISVNLIENFAHPAFREELIAMVRHYNKIKTQPWNRPMQDPIVGESTVSASPVCPNISTLQAIDENSMAIGTPTSTSAPAVDDVAQMFPKASLISSDRKASIKALQQFKLMPTNLTLKDELDADEAKKNLEIALNIPKFRLMWKKQESERDRHSQYFVEQVNKFHDFKDQCLATLTAMHTQAITSAEEEHEQLLSKLEDKHCIDEGKLLRTHEEERRNCEIKAKHQENYYQDCISGVSGRLLSEQDKHELAAHRRALKTLPLKRRDAISVLRAKQTREVDQKKLQHEKRLKELKAQYAKDLREVKEGADYEYCELKAFFKERQNRLSRRWSITVEMWKKMQDGTVASLVQRPFDFPEWPSEKSTTVLEMRT